MGPKEAPSSSSASSSQIRVDDRDATVDTNKFGTAPFSDVEGPATFSEPARPDLHSEVSAPHGHSPHDREYRANYPASHRPLDRSNRNREEQGFPRYPDDGLSPSQERRYQYELEMMKAREQQELSYQPSGGDYQPNSAYAHPSDYYSGMSTANRDENDARHGSTAVQRPSLEGFSRVENGKRYRLVVVQHPSRARMCGFGDKDRRPLSPTLIVKLVITDEETGKEINPLDVNTSLFLLATDLCHPDDLMLAPRNILVHHHASALPMSSMGYGQAAGRAGDPSYRSGAYGDGTASDIDSRTRGNGYGLSPQEGPGPGGYGGSTLGGTSVQFGSNFLPGQAESYTRNLVGAAVASASVLKDEQDKWCIFFVFQDISVRTEGVYRIKLMFVNLEVNGRVGTGISEALAETYTDPFTVYSPRRFPGMLDPTPLSRKLASQGIKIPVRNDKKKQRRRADDGDAGGDGGLDYDGGSGGDDDDE